jgi:hypothetical protein
MIYLPTYLPIYLLSESLCSRLRLRNIQIQRLSYSYNVVEVAENTFMYSPSFFASNTKKGFKGPMFTLQNCLHLFASLNVRLFLFHGRIWSKLSLYNADMIYFLGIFGPRRLGYLTTVCHAGGIGAGAHCEGFI